MTRYRQRLSVIAPLVAGALLLLPPASFAQNSSGTAFEVTDSGYLLTNHHVVAGCKSVSLRKGNLEDPAQVVASDANLDLALLSNPSRLMDRINHRRLTGGAAIPYARFPQDKDYLLLGEAVIAVGFPLRGFVGGINVTTGVVSSTDGPPGVPTVFQITAPIQGGNSGGPVLNARGTVIGVVVGQLDAAKMQQLVGVTPQNVNFAIQGKLARDFVRKSAGSVAMNDAGSPPGTSDTATIANNAAQYTYQVLCY
jgi:S1-C subfamily serine protease